MSYINRGQGFVYCFSKAPKQHMKIGMTFDLPRRIKDHILCEGNVRLQFLILTNDPRTLERQIHIRCQDYLIPGTREWYILTPAQLGDLFIHYHAVWPTEQLLLTHHVDPVFCKRYRNIK